MADIELDNFDKEAEEEQPEDQQEEETNVDTDWRDESVIIIDGSNPNARKNLNAMKDADRELGKRIGETKKNIRKARKIYLKKMGVNVVKGDGPSSKAVLERLKVNYSKGIPVSVEFDNVEIIVKEGENMVYTDDAIGASKVNEFKELLHSVNNYYANGKIINISNGTDAIRIRLRQDELYIIV